jgi:CheY-like chemotaxis protein
VDCRVVALALDLLFAAAGAGVQMKSSRALPAFPWSVDSIAAPRVLVADDDAAVRRGVALTLKRRGFQVLESADGAELFELVARFARAGAAFSPDARIDLVITDLKMPRLDGLEVLELLADAGWELPVILMSGLCDAAVHERAARLSVACVLDKPFNAEKLIAAVSSLVALPTAQG